MVTHKGVGLVCEALSGFDSSQKGISAIGHVLYTSDKHDEEKSVQPITVQIDGSPLSIALNGKISNAKYLRKVLTQQGFCFKTYSDSEIILGLICNAKAAVLENKIVSALRQVKGAYSIIFQSDYKLIAIRDPNGCRPLCFGCLNGRNYVFASESCALNEIGAKLVRDLLPGEMVVFDVNGEHSYQSFYCDKSTFCIFEYIYFSCPGSVIDGMDVGLARREMGKALAREVAFDADVVVAVPDSGIPAAIGYSTQSGIPLVQGIVKNSQTGRSFTLPKQQLRNQMVRRKLNVIEEIVCDKNVLLVDDSIVRGSTMRNLIPMVRCCGAKKVFVCSASPPIVNPCCYDIDISTRQELIAPDLAVEEIADYIGCDGLHFLSMGGLLSAIKDTDCTHICKECLGQANCEMPLAGVGLTTADC